MCLKSATYIIISLISTPFVVIYIPKKRQNVPETSVFTGIHRIFKKRLLC